MAHEVIHFNGYTSRVVGAGDLVGTFKGLDNVFTKSILPLTLSATNYKEPTRLSNFVSQRARLRLETLLIDEWAKITKLTIWVKSTATGYPM